MISLGIEGQWSLELGLSYKGTEVSDEELSPITPANLREFYCIEETGNNLPTFSISFSANEKWKRYWNENSHLKMALSIAKGEKKVVDTKMAILTKDVTDVGNGMFIYKAQGVYVGDKNATVMCQTPFIQTIGPTEGTDCIEQCAKKFFKKVTVKGKSTGSHAWFQSHQSCKKFLDHVVQHSYIENSFVSVGITMNGEYIVIDTAKECKGAEAWTIGDRDGDKNISIVAPPIVKSRSGALNTFGGYGLELPIISAEKGLRTNYQVKVDLGLSGKKSPETGNVQRRTLAPVYFSGANEDAGFVKAPANYMYGQLLLSMEVMEVTTLTFDKEVKVLDVIKVIDMESGTNRASQDASGKYMVGKVVRGITDGLAVMRIQMTRESGLQQ